MLEKHPDTMTDSELYQKIDSLVRTKTPESIFFDYKKELTFHNEKGKIELAKDISSFANTEGGYLIYGIDEEREGKNSVPIPKEGYGIEPIKGELIDIENILSGIISPQLPDLIIRAIQLEHDHSKSVYIMWHPKSWFAPHMVSGYKHTRYYRRGNFKSWPMQEHEVELKYRERSATFYHTKDFIDKIDYGLKHFHSSTCFLKIAVAPLYLSIDNKYFSYQDAEKLFSNSRTGYPISFLDGIAYISAIRRFVVKIYFNGIITLCYNIDNLLEDHVISDNILSYRLFRTSRLKEILERSIMPYVFQFFNNISFRGPILINLSIDNAKNILLGHTSIQLHKDEKLIADYIYQNDIFEFNEIFPIIIILGDQNKIIEILMERINNGFGFYNFNTY